MKQRILHCDGMPREAPIYLINWYQYDDVVGPWNNQYFGIEAGFMAEKRLPL